MKNLFTRRNIIIGGILILVLLITAIFLFGFKEAPKSPIDIFKGNFPGRGRENPSGIQQPLTNEKSVEQILREQGPRSIPQWSLFQLGQDPVASLVAFGTTTQYHKITAENLGHLFTRSKDTLDREARISNLLIQQIARVVWSPKGNKSVVAYYYDDAQNIKRFFIEYQGTTTPKTHFLDNNIVDAAFSPQGDKIAYIDSSGESNNIFVTDTGFKKTQQVLNNAIPDFEISWPAQNTLALKTKSSYATEGFLYVFNTNGGLLQKIVQGLGLDAIWSTDGKRILYSMVNISQQPQPAKVFELAIKKTLELPLATIAEKCVFGKKNPRIVYCGVPRSFPAGSYPDAWWQGKVSFSDTIAIINTETGRQVVSLPTDSDIINPVIFDDDSYLFFRDKTTNMLWGLKLTDDSRGELPK